ncbi:MAG TPA: hypothetical protein PLQ41_08685 [bacterium]|nr:hypothetical protein [bacterium]
MGKQIHRRLADEQVKGLLERYCSGEVELEYILKILEIKRRQFFKILKRYREDTASFSIAYNRQEKTRQIPRQVEMNIIKELKIERFLIEDPAMPVRNYNYSYVRDQLWKNYKQKVSVPTIIDRAKKNDFYLPKKEHKKHDREVLTNYAGELIQHDSSQHKWSPYADKKWYLITSLDDYSRKMLYADLVERETTWDHIAAMESIFLKYGLPLSFYVDSHSIFRFVQGRDSFWRKHYKVTDDADPQWKQVLIECGVKITYALSPQAKGKVERPYGWLQDRIVRTCARENIKEIRGAREVLRYEMDRYNRHQVHSATREIPDFRFYNALNDKKTLFRQFILPPPFESTKDVFCLRAERMINSYRKVSLNNLELKVSGAPLHSRVQMRIVPDKKTGIAEVRFWYKDKLIDIQKVKNEDLNLVHF